MQHRRAGQAAGRAGRGAQPSPNLDGRDVLRRITGKAAMRQLKEHITPYLEPLQYGAGSNRGCAHIHTLLREQLRRCPDFVLLKCDVSNAFNSMSRDAFMPEMESKFPALLPLVTQFYLEPSNLIVRGSDGGICVLKSVSGQQQGDTLGSLLFSIHQSITDAGAQSQTQTPAACTAASRSWRGWRATWAATCTSWKRTRCGPGATAPPPTWTTAARHARSCRRS
jgi:hypothetical protein